MFKLFRGKKKIGLVLGSGAAKGLAHIGVIKALRERDVPIDMLAGSSMGAFVAACYAKNGEIKDFEESILKVDWKQLTQLADPNIALLYKGIINGKKVKEFLKMLIGDIEFKDLKIPLVIVATDANTGEEVILKEGSVIEAVRASISIPAVFTPVKLGGRFLLDGGIVNPMPVKVARDMGADFVIACNVMQRLSIRKKDSIEANNNVSRSLPNNKIMEFFRLKKFKRIPKIDPDTPGVFDVIIKTIFIMENEILKSRISGADLVISPDMRDVALIEFYRAKESIERGYRAAIDIVSANSELKKRKR